MIRLSAFPAWSFISLFLMASTFCNLSRAQFWSHKIKTPLVWVTDQAPAIQILGIVVREGFRRNDCTEKPTNQKDFIAKLSDTKTNDPIDFLKSIPDGSMQNFTLVYKSESSQKDGVTTNWPRVIRWSKDGKTHNGLYM